MLARLSRPSVGGGIVSPEDPDREILIEMNRLGAATDVRALSASDGLEVSFTVPAGTARADVERLARAKLSYVRARRSARSGGPGKPDTKGGLLV
jgi:hypothetical protein